MAHRDRPERQDTRRRWLLSQALSLSVQTRRPLAQGASDENVRYVSAAAASWRVDIGQKEPAETVRRVHGGDGRAARGGSVTVCFLAVHQEINGGSDVRKGDVVKRGASAAKRFL